MKRFTNAGRVALKSDNLYAALSLALTLPDICGSIEQPGRGKTQARYESWYTRWLQPKYLSPAFRNLPETIFLTASDCFQLRCSLIHSGSAEIDETKRNRLDRFVFFDNTETSHCNFVNTMVDGVPHRYLQLNASQFSLDMYEAVDAWDASILGDANLQAEKAKLLFIHSTGAIIGGVQFGH